MAENGGQKTTIWWWLKSSKMLIFLLKMLKNGEMLTNVGENIKKKKFALIFFYTQDIKNIIFNPKFYQHFLPSSNNIICFN